MFETLEEAIKNEISQETDLLSGGKVRDFEMYQRVVGRIDAYRRVLEEMKNIEKMYSEM